MTLYHLLDHPELDDPLMIMALDAWVDAGSAATSAAALLREGATTIAGIDADGLYDYRSRRPTLRIVDGHPQELEWPELEVVHRRFPERDVLILSGPEPDYRWRELAAELVMLASDLGVTEWLTLGAIPAAVPHTRPVPVLGIESRDGLLKGGIEPGPAGSMKVPAAAVSIVDLAIAEAGIPTLGYFAQVPHYISGEYPAAAVALIRAVERHIGASVTTAVLELEARGIHARLDVAASADDSTKAYIARLEEMVDEARLPSGDELIGEIERFLRDRGTGSGPIH
ncbi:MAG TPA: PAC2 family protein [Candidatus Limnocylindrales bacterium]|nr:PAC2 family protein [Candidatus Limnocylindrales bacterium]